MKAPTVSTAAALLLLATTADAQFATSIANQYQILPNVTYLTAEAGPAGPKFRADPYDRDPALLARYFGDGQQQVAAVAP